MRRRGFTLMELLLVVGLMAIIATLAAPSFTRMMAWMRVRRAANQVAVDLARSRHLAVRWGQRSVLRIVRAPECPGEGGHVYWAVVRRGDDSVHFRTDLRPAGGRVCLRMNGSDSLVFTSRGILYGFNNRTLVVSHGSSPALDSLTLSVVGRVMRRF